MTTVEEQEEWSWVPGYEGYYEVSSLGNVRSVDREVEPVDGRIFRFEGKPLRGYNNRGSVRVNLCKEAQRRSASISHIVWQVFISEQVPTFIGHRDGDIYNNRWDNLEEKLYANVSSNGPGGTEAGVPATAVRFLPATPRYGAA